MTYDRIGYDLVAALTISRGIPFLNPALRSRWIWCGVALKATNNDLGVTIGCCSRQDGKNNTLHVAAALQRKTHTAGQKAIEDYSLLG